MIGRRDGLADPIGSGSSDRALAVVGGRLCTDLAEVTSDLAALDTEGFWAVVIPFEGEVVCARFNSVRPARPWPGTRWSGPSANGWSDSLPHPEFVSAVHEIRSEIAAGNVYQVNLTRHLSAPLSESPRDGTPAAGSPSAGAETKVDIAALGAELAAGNPAPFSAVVRLPDQGIHVASASPELFLARRGRRIWSSPIKGTSSTRDGFLAKDAAENVMIVDLVRNDLGRVCEWGSVHVPALMEIEEHPGLFHLVSTVEGTLREGLGWADAIDATFPPGSVTGAPKLAALDVISRLEPQSRGVYCGAIGWVDADRGQGELNVAIRTFWMEGGRLHFGTGGAITYDSDPEGEWAETSLKASNLLRVAQGESTSASTSGGTVFETLELCNGHPFALQRHLDLLDVAARSLGLHPPPEARIREAVSETVQRWGKDPGRLRVSVSADSRNEDRLRLQVTSLSIPSGPARVSTAGWALDAGATLSGLKTSGMTAGVASLAADPAADEILLFNRDGHLTEGCSSNVFVVIDGELSTPPLATGCRAGVTRSLVIESLADSGVVVREATLTRDMLAGVEEAFLTSTGRHVQPIGSIDSRPLRVDGPLTRTAKSSFAQLRSALLI